MTIAALGEDSEAAGSSAADAGSNAASKKSSPLAAVGSEGLLALPKIGKSVPTPRTQHPYIAGLLLIIVGGVGLIGSITGNLPAMIAALFDPDTLAERQSGAGVVSSIIGDVGTGFTGVLLGPVAPYVGIIGEDLGL